jgi:hypothetical protein
MARVAAVVEKRLGGLVALADLQELAIDAVILPEVHAQSALSVVYLLHLDPPGLEISRRRQRRADATGLPVLQQPRTCRRAGSGIEGTRLALPASPGSVPHRDRRTIQHRPPPSDTMRLHTLFMLGAAAAAATVSACGSDATRDETPADTLAVPAAAVDTTTTTVTDSAGAAVTTGVPGAGTAETGAEKATGVDTPITRRLREKEAARDTTGGAARPD